MPQPSSVWCSDHSICYIGAAVLTCGCITVRWHIHLPSGSPLPAAWYSLWILSLFKEAGRLVFPCCIAAISTAFDLKNASPLFRSLHWWWLTLQHTLQKSPLMHPRGRERRGERKRKKREGYFCLCACNTQCLFMCPDLPAPFTQIPVLISIPCGSLQGGNAAGVFAPLECIMHLFGQTVLLSATVECWG